jgi:hypothetical protein
MVKFFKDEQYSYLISPYVPKISWRILFRRHDMHNDYGMNTV